MFAKLLKHELKAQGKIVGILSLASLGAGIIGSLVLAYLINGISYAANERADAIKIVFSTMVLVGVFFGIAAYAISVNILLLVRFYQRHFTDQGYLTFTLPATSHQILLSSIVNIAIWSVVSLVVTFVSFIIVFMPVVKDIATDLRVLESIADVYQEAFSIVYGVDAPVIQLFSNLSSALYSLILPLLAITIGAQIAKKHKLLAAFGIYYGLNIAISIITGIFSVFWLMSDYFVDGSITITLSTVLNSVLYLGIAIGGYFIMHHLVDKKLNLP